MILFPAIDLKDGQCVRLKRGAMDEATVFNDSPAAQARAFAEGRVRVAALRGSEWGVRRPFGQCRGDPGDP